MSSKSKRTEPKTAIVTGASGGLGARLAASLAGAGLNLVLTYNRNGGAAAKLCKELPGEVEAVRADVARYGDAQKAVLRADKLFGGADVLINNAGIHDDSPVIRMSARQWDSVIATNLKGAFNFTKAILPGMKARGFGRIVNVSSFTAFSGTAGAANYAASKAGIVGLTKSAAREVARYNITVNSVSPGYFDAGMFYHLDQKARETIIGRIPAGRLGRPEELSELVLVLISCGYITGQDFVLDGGFSA